MKTAEVASDVQLFWPDSLQSVSCQTSPECIVLCSVIAANQVAVDIMAALRGASLPTLTEQALVGVGFVYETILFLNDIFIYAFNILIIGFLRIYTFRLYSFIIIIYFYLFQCSFLPKFSISIRTRFENNNGSSENVRFVYIF